MLLHFAIFYLLVGGYFDLVNLYFHRSTLNVLEPMHIVGSLIAGLICWPLLVVEYVENY